MESHLYESGKVDRWFDGRRQCGEIAAPTGSHRDKAEPAAGRRRSRRINAGHFGPWVCLSVIATTMLYACSTSHGSSQTPGPALAQSEGHIYVTSGWLNGDCYQDLGQLTLNESFAQSVVEEGDSQAQRLRELAREKYSAKVDAIINVHEQQNDAGTAVEITGEAVHVQNHETVACAARGIPGVVDSAAATAAGGIVGTVVGGLAASAGGAGVTGAEAGGAIGATAVAGIELAKHRRQQQAEEAFVSDRLDQQRNEIARLYQQLAKLIEQQCNTEELSEQDCNQRIATVQQQIAKTDEAAQGSELPGRTASASNGAMTEFQIRNRIQEQQEIIDQLQQRIAQIKQSTDNQ
jgi:hypothetical protein